MRDQQLAEKQTPRPDAASPEPVRRPAFPWRLALLAAALVVSVLLAVAAWQPHPKPSPPPGPGESHLLSEDKALCLRVGFVLNRSASYDLDLRLGLYSSIDPAAIRPLGLETAGLRQASSDYPTSAPGIRRAVDAAASATSDVLLYGHGNSYIDSVTSRAAAVSALRDTCFDIAGFDTFRMTVVT